MEEAGECDGEGPAGLWPGWLVVPADRGPAAKTWLQVFTGHTLKCQNQKGQKEKSGKLYNRQTVTWRPSDWLGQMRETEASHTTRGEVTWSAGGPPEPGRTSLLSLADQARLLFAVA